MNGLPDELHPEIANLEDDDVDIAFECFFEWYQKAWLYEKDAWEALQMIPRPTREFVITHQAWGLLGADGLGGYFNQYDARFDDEVARGMRLLYPNLSTTVLTKARRSFAPDAAVLGREEEQAMWSELYCGMEDVERRIGDRLIRAVRAL